jgi:hypothetical protein
MYIYNHRNIPLTSDPVGIVFNTCLYVCIYTHVFMSIFINRIGYTHMEHIYIYIYIYIYMYMNM